MHRSDVPGPSNLFVDDQLQSMMGADWANIPLADASFRDEVDLNKAVIYDDAGIPRPDPLYARPDTPRPGPSGITTRQSTPTHKLYRDDLGESIISYDDSTIIAEDQQRHYQTPSRPLSPILGPYRLKPSIPTPGLDDSFTEADLTGDRPYSVEDATKEYYEKLWQTGSINELRQFVKNNYYNHIWLRHLTTRLKTMISVFASEDQKILTEKRGWNLDDMMNVVWDLLADCKKKVKTMATTVDSPKAAKAMDLNIEIEKSRQKMGDVIKDLEDLIGSQKREIAALKQKVENTTYLRAELETAKQQLRLERDKNKYIVQDPLSYEEFAYDLQYKLAAEEFLSSSLREELMQERKSRQEIQELFERAQRQRILDYDGRMQAYNKAMKYMEMHEVIREAIVSKIDALKPNPKKAKKAVDEWLRTITDVLKLREVNVYNTTLELRNIDSHLERLMIDLEKRKEEVDAVKSELDNTNALLEKYRSTVIRKGNELQNLSQQERMPILSDQERTLSPEDADRTIQERREAGRASSISPEYHEKLDDSLLIDETPPRTPLQHSTPSPISPYIATPLPVTPFVSKSRFGYTDPSVPFGDLNMPPAPFEMSTPFQQTVLLKSLIREEPLLLNIAVDPKPLTDTDRGERFVCDISLDLQSSHRTLPQLPGISPIIKGRRIGRHNVPPDVTPTTTRRHGLFTPRGIFKERQFNLRRIADHPISELPWSPTYLPEDARSPASPFPPSPPHWSDKSISWERDNESYYRTPKRLSPVFKGPKYRQRSPDWDSPVIRKPLSVTQYQSFDSSTPSAAKGSTVPRYVSPDWEFNLRSPIIKKSSYRYPSPDWEFNLRSPGIKGPTYQSPYSAPSSPSPVIMPRTPDRRLPDGTYGSGSFERERSLHDTSRFGEGRFLD